MGHTSSFAKGGEVGMAIILTTWGSKWLHCFKNSDISLFRQECQYLSPLVLPISALSALGGSISARPLSCLLMFLFKTSQLSSLLTKCSLLHKHECAPLPISVKNGVSEINCNCQQVAERDKRGKITTHNNWSTDIFTQWPVIQNMDEYMENKALSEV